VARRPIDVKIVVKPGAVISIALLAATLSPIVRDPLDDAFPLSTYPMFAVPRAPEQRVDYAIGITATGERRTLRVRHLGTGEVMAAVALLDHAIHSTNEAALAACRDIAARIAGDAAYADVVTVRLVTALHDAVAFVREGKVGREAERVSCPVVK
jgi:hypothetical protein